MTNQEKGWKNYSNGLKFEMRSHYKLNKGSILTHRSAGSRTEIDIISYRKSGKVWWVVCKRNGYLPPAEITALKKLYSKIKEGHGTIIIKLAYMESKVIKFVTI